MGQDLLLCEFAFPVKTWKRGVEIRFHDGIFLYVFPCVFLQLDDRDEVKYVSGVISSFREKLGHVLPVNSVHHLSSARSTVEAISLELISRLRFLAPTVDRKFTDAFLSIVDLVSNIASRPFIFPRQLFHDHLSIHLHRLRMKHVLFV